MDYRLQSISISAYHLSKLRISVYGDAYMMGASLRDGVNADIIVHYMSGTYGLDSKTVDILVLTTFNSVREFDIKDFVPVDIVTKSDGKVYGVFAKFS